METVFLRQKAFSHAAAAQGTKQANDLDQIECTLEGGSYVNGEAFAIQ